ncbi:hypothetical protein ACFC26_40880 [Kitasatospora purpeofusca]|uniref:hypothetical protein n=1 Tax=Kitasatospora purpeofusca TaxID=67352 RepID=UPI0035D67F74
MTRCEACGRWVGRNLLERRSWSSYDQGHKQWAMRTAAPEVSAFFAGPVPCRNLEEDRP